MIARDPSEIMNNNKETETATPETNLSLPYLPDIPMTKVFSFLSPKDLLSCSQVCKDWHRLAFQPGLWKVLYPVLWARNIWTFTPDWPTIDSKDNFALVHSSSNESLSSLDSFTTTELKGEITMQSSELLNRPTWPLPNSWSLFSHGVSVRPSQK